MIEKIKSMLELQDKLNIDTNGKNWREGVTPNGKIINWKRCIYMESAEAIDSISWKHWKNVEGGVDYENFKVELIDIWHFLMSYLMTKYDIKESINIISENLKVGDPQIKKLPKKLTPEDNLNLDIILKPYEDLMVMSLDSDVSLNYNKNFIKIFFLCLYSAEVSFDDLYNLYIGKNVLNKFRQDNGYKQGTYKKIWANGKEDNVTMQFLIEKNQNLSFDELYTKLEEEYKK